MNLPFLTHHEGIGISQHDLEHLWADAKPVPASEWMPDESADEQ